MEFFYGLVSEPILFHILITKLTQKLGTMLVTFSAEMWLGYIINVKEEWNTLQDNLDDI